MSVTKLIISAKKKNWMIIDGIKTSIINWLKDINSQKSKKQIQIVMTECHYISPI